MIIGTVPKQPYERFPIWIDFAPWHQVGQNELPNTITVTARDAATGVDATAEVLEGEPYKDGSKVLSLCKAGVAGKTYIVEFSEETTLSNKWQAELKLVVKED